MSEGQSSLQPTGAQPQPIKPEAQPKKQAGELSQTEVTTLSCSELRPVCRICLGICETCFTRGHCRCYNCHGSADEEHSCFRAHPVSNQETKHPRTLSEIFEDDWKELPRTFGECLDKETRQRLEQHQDFNLTRFETYFKTWEEQHCAVAFYLRLEHRINADALIENIGHCERTGEAPIQVYLRFKGFFQSEERDVIVGEWRRKYGWGIWKNRR